MNFISLNTACTRVLARFLAVSFSAAAISACASNPLYPTYNASDEIARQTTAQPGNAILPVTGNGLRGNRVIVYQPTAMPGPRLVKVQTSPVRVSRSFSGNPYNPAHVPVGSRIPQQAPDELSRWILVSGNYTPKGIYLRPDSSSRILTRVAPGSRLRLEKTIDGWHKVETEQGIGYLRGHDAKILASTKPGAKTRVIKPASS